MGSGVRLSVFKGLKPTCALVICTVRDIPLLPSLRSRARSYRTTPLFVFHSKSSFFANATGSAFEKSAELRTSAILPALHQLSHCHPTGSLCRFHRALWVSLSPPLGAGAEQDGRICSCLSLPSGVGTLVFSCLWTGIHPTGALVLKPWCLH
jgi:hypothetical protein